MTPSVINNSDATIFFKPEKTQYGLENKGVYPIPANSDLYIPVGMHCLKKQSVFKLSAMNLLVKIISIVPWIYLLAFYSYVFRIASEIGYVPSYNNPDPSYMHVLHRGVVIHSFAISFFGSILGVFALVFFHRKMVNSTTRKYVLLFLVGVLLLIFNIFIDPLDTWFLD